MGLDWVLFLQKRFFCPRNPVFPLPSASLYPCSLQTYRYSILPALSLDGILHLAVEDHPYTAQEFNSFVDVLLDNMNQFPGANLVIVMGNASIHKSGNSAI